MKVIKANLIVVGMVLALIAFVSPASAVTSPASAVTLGDHEITFVSHTFDGTYSTWTYQVTSNPSGEGVHAISNWILAWCNENAIVEVSEAPYVYGTDPNTGITGIKFDKGYADDGESRTVWFKLMGDFPEDTVEVGLKAGNDVDTGYITGPLNCDYPIPEFSTIAIPVAAVLGLLFLFNHRKHRRND